MTRDEILNMPAGHEMDKLITEFVFGMRLEKNHGLSGGFYWVGNGVQFGDMRMREVPDYSTDISDAWNVFEKFTKEPFAWHVETVNLSDGKLEYWACLWGDHGSSIVEYSASAETASLAICRAALLATMKE